MIPDVSCFTIVMSPTEERWTSDDQCVAPNERQKERRLATSETDAVICEGADAIRWMDVFLDDEFASINGQS